MVLSLLSLLSVLIKVLFHSQGHLLNIWPEGVNSFRLEHQGDLSLTEDTQYVTMFQNIVMVISGQTSQSSKTSLETKLQTLSALDEPFHDPCLTFTPISTQSPHSPDKSVGSTVLNHPPLGYYFVFPAPM